MPLSTTAPRSAGKPARAGGRVRVALSLALAASGGPARAGPPPITWDAPAECPSQAQVEALAAAMLARSTRNAAPDMRVHFAVGRDGTGQWRLRGTLSAAEGSGERTLTASRCTTLAEAAALIAALAVDPDAASADLPVPEARDPPDPIVPVPPPVEPRPAPPTPVPTDIIDPGPPTPGPAPALARVQGELGLGAGLGLGALPRPAALLRAHGGARGRFFRAGARVSAWLPREAPVPDHPEVGGRFWLVSGGLYACGVTHLGRRVTVPLCAAVDVGVYGGRGIGALMNARSARSAWVGVAAGPGLQVEVHRRLAVLLAVEGLAVIARPRFQISGVGQPCCDRVLGGTFTAGLELRLR